MYVNPWLLVVPGLVFFGISAWATDRMEKELADTRKLEYVDPKKWEVRRTRFGLLRLRQGLTLEHKGRFPESRLWLVTRLCAACGFLLLLLWRFDVAKNPSEIERQQQQANRGFLQSLGR